MKRKPCDPGLLIVCLVILLFLSLTARAQDAAPTAVTFSGFVDVAYVWNANRPSTGENFVPGTGTSGRRAGEVMLNLAQVQWSRAVSVEQPAGFTVALVAGEGTDVVHSGEPDGGDALRHVYQASIAYRLGNGVLIEGGIFPCHVGIEGFYSKDNWNYTRSWLGELSPYYVAGVKASYAFGERWSGQLHVLNGWQIVNDTNGGKSIGAQLAYSRGPFKMSLNTFAGPELPDDDDSLRELMDVVVFYEVSPRLQFGGSVDLGVQQLPGTEDANWRGIAGYARYAIDDRHALAIRAEEFRDPQSGISGAKQTLQEVTLTYELRPRDRVIVKLETRSDRSTADVFGKGDGHTDRQFLALAVAVVTF